MTDPEGMIERILNCPDLPTIPGIPIQVLQLTQDPDADARDIAKVMGQDPVLAAKVLKAANYLVPRQVSSLPQAVAMLGIRAVSTLALGVSLSGAIQKAPAQSEALDAGWRRRLYSGLAGRALATETRLAPADEVFLNCLFQDVGMLGMIAALGEEYEAILQTAENHESLSLAEQEALGADHAAVGAAMADHWSLPPRLIAPIEYHHRLDEAPDEVGPTVRLVWGARMVANVLLKEDADLGAVVVQAALGQQFDFSGEQIQGLQERSAAEAEEVAGIFNVQAVPADEMVQILAQAQQVLVQGAMEADAEARRLRTANEELTELVGTDRLTGLQNRASLDEIMPTLFEDFRAGDDQLSALFMDVDHFKLVNDTHGHAIGDEVLRRVGRILSQAFGKRAYRYGGEEIVCLLPGHDESKAIDAAERIRETVAAEEIDDNGQQFRVTVSIGVASTDGTTEPTTVEGLIAAADKAVYAAKDAGRNRVVAASSMAAATD